MIHSLAYDIQSGRIDKDRKLSKLVTLGLDRGNATMKVSVSPIILESRLLGQILDAINNVMMEFNPPGFGSRWFENPDRWE